MRATRWTSPLKHVGPRLAVFAVLAAALHYGLPPLLKRSLIESGQELVKAPVEIGDVDVSLLSSRLVVRDVAVADPKDPWSNVLAADSVVLEIEPGSLARKRVVVRRGTVRGLRFDTPRTASGDWAGEDRIAPLGRFLDSAAERGQAWLGAYWFNLSSKLEEDLRQEFRSIALAEELASRWPHLYEEQRQQVEALLARGQAIDARVRAARQNPLRNLASLRDATQEIERLNRDLGKLVEQLHGLEPRLAGDREAVWTAWEADRQKLAEGIALEPVDDQAISDYLLQEEVAGRVGTIVRWIERVRMLVPAAGDTPRTSPGRGVDVLFAGLRRHPDYLVRSLDLHGQVSSDGGPFELTGTIIGLTPQPSIHGRPTVARIIGRGPVQLDIEASLDRTGDVPVDRFVVHCPLIPRPRAALGRPDAFAVAVEDGREELHAEVTLEGSKLTGTVTMTIDTGGLGVASNEASAATHLAASLSKRLETIHTIETTLHLDGTLGEPKVQMESTLGSQVLAAVQAAAIEEAAARRQELELALKRQIEDKLGELERVVTEQRRQLEQRLSEQQTTLIRLAADTFGLGDRPTIRLGSSDAGEERPDSRESAFQR